MSPGDRIRITIPGDPDHGKLGTLLRSDDEYDWLASVDDRDKEDYLLLYESEFELVSSATITPWTL